MPYFIIIGAFFAMLSVVLGAMGAHALKAILDAQALTAFQTATTYQMYHALAMILTALSIPYANRPAMLNKAGWFFMLGIILFSGSLYGLSVFGIKSLGIITPIGGLFFILAWLFFAASFVINKAEKN